MSIARMDGNLYADWIKTYSDPAFDAATDKAIAICDQLAEAASEEVRARMTDIFFKASRMEWCFLGCGIYAAPVGGLKIADDEV